MGQYNTLRGLKLPASETVESIAAVLRSHWRAASQAPLLRRFGSAAWLQGFKVRAITMRIEAGVHHLTRGGRLIR